MGELREKQATMTPIERFESWLKDRYGDIFEITGDSERDTSVRLVRVIGLEAYQAAEHQCAEIMKALHQIAEKDPDHLMHDPLWARRVAQCALDKLRY